MTGAIEFLKHAREMCDNTDCEYCAYCNKIEQCEVCCKITLLADYEIADLVREVERWHRERSKDEKNKSVD